MEQTECLVQSTDRHQWMAVGARGQMSCLQSSGSSCLSDEQSLQIGRLLLVVLNSHRHQTKQKPTPFHPQSCKRDSKCRLENKQEEIYTVAVREAIKLRDMHTLVETR